MFDESITLEEYAKYSAGNWKKFSSYARFWQRDDEDDWAVIYTSNPSSTLKEKVDSLVIDKALKGFDEDVDLYIYTHWTVGYLTGMLIRVYKDGVITDAFKRLYELQQKAIWECLDEGAFYNGCYSLVLQDIECEVRGLYEGDQSTLSVAEKVYEHLSENGFFADQYDDPCFPSTEEVKEALQELGYVEVECC